jgi:GNAT superfamily N-acetyltransferase
MENLNFIPIKANEIELKYNDIQFPLVFNYIGPNRIHGDLYYDLTWYEVIYNYNVVSLICLNNGKYYRPSLHLSVLEVFEKNKGIGTKIMDFLFEYAKSLKYSHITLQALDSKAKLFYLRLGFIPKLINGTPFLIKKL